MMPCIRPLFCACLVVGASPLLAQEEPLLLRTGTHEGGFLRMAFAKPIEGSLEHTLVGSAKISQDVAVPFRLWAGWSVAPCWALHLSLIDIMAGSGSDSYSAMSFGAGLTHYFPANVFASAQVGFSPLVPPSGFGTQGGMRWTLALGKEIQVSSCNGLGAMFTLDGGSWEDSDSGDKWSLLAPGLQLVWTYN